ncbi:ASC domain containing protein [Asbolus verrucosus]|uniref:ASC domain containing protein n=1 Tax=Asbolus verrucosus TaxID=1661398 RepID=A0A482V8X9_ASBVE|nr:ASC domain containing protein [Asbolus verrucosus]
MESIKFLGNLYDYSYDISDRGEIDYFQNILDGLQLKIREIMRNLTTPCEDFLKICHWKGVAVNCSKIFQLRRTFEGDCCTFNYFKITQDWWMRRDDFSNLTHGEPGTQNGLSVLVNDEPEDYYCTVISSMGINVQVFIPGDYPDKASGGLIESICDIGSENFLEVIPTTVAAVSDVMNHPVDKRQCLFEEEELTQFGVYSQSDCFVDCRMRSMMALCQCIPFTIPWSTDPTACTLRDLPCLNRYRGAGSAIRVIFVY